MPRLYSAGVALELSTATLATTTTTSPIRVQSVAATRQIQAQNAAFEAARPSNTLLEQHLMDSVQILDQDIPFLMVRCGMSAVEEDIEDRLALCLTVQLDPRSFEPFYHVNAQKACRDLKIDCFVNGRLCQSSTLSATYRVGQASKDFLTVRITGRRNGRLTECPLVLNPRNRASASCQWSTVSHSLADEIALLSTNEEIRVPKLQALISELCQLECPECLCCGIIDIIISYGEGARLSPTTSYLTAPMLALSSFGARSSIACPSESKKLRSEDSSTISAYSPVFSPVTLVSSESSWESDPIIVKDNYYRVSILDDGPLRNVSSVRGSWFREEGILMAVRYVIE